MKKLLWLAVFAAGCLPTPVRASESEACIAYKKIVDEALALPVATTDWRILEKKKHEYEAARMNVRAAPFSFARKEVAKSNCLLYKMKEIGDWDIEATIKARAAQEEVEARFAPYRAAVDALLALDLTTVSLPVLTTKYNAMDKEFRLLSSDDRKAAKLYKSYDLDCYEAVCNQFCSVNVIGTAEEFVASLLKQKDISKADLKQQEKNQDAIDFPLTLIKRHFAKGDKLMPVFGFLRRYNELVAALDEKIKAFDAPTTAPAPVATSSASASSASAPVTRVAPARSLVKDFNAEFKRRYEEVSGLINANPLNVSDSLENLKTKHKKLLDALKTYRAWVSDFNTRATAARLAVQASDPDTLVTLVGDYFRAIQNKERSV